MKKILERDLVGNWNTVPPVSEDKIKEVNCHKFALFVLGKISWEEMIGDLEVATRKGEDFTYGEIARNLSAKSFTFVSDFNALENLVSKECSSAGYYLAQIRDVKTNEMAHSFILEKKLDNQVVCFDKPGFKYNFAVTDLKQILNFVNKDGEMSNQNQEWRFVPIV